jgi:hypothetical protein
MLSRFSGRARPPAGDWFLVTEYIESESLDTYARGKRHLRNREAIDVVRDIIEALIAIHPDSARLLELDAKNKSGELCPSELLPGVVGLPRGSRARRNGLYLSPSAADRPSRPLPV